MKGKAPKFRTGQPRFKIVNIVADPNGNREQRRAAKKLRRKR